MQHVWWLKNFKKFLEKFHIFSINRYNFIDAESYRRFFYFRFNFLIFLLFKSGYFFPFSNMHAYVFRQTLSSVFFCFFFFNNQNAKFASLKLEFLQNTQKVWKSSNYLIYWQNTWYVDKTRYFDKSFWPFWKCNIYDVALFDPIWPDHYRWIPSFFPEVKNTMVNVSKFMRNNWNPEFWIFWIFFYILDT